MGRPGKRTAPGVADRRMGMSGNGMVFPTPGRRGERNCRARCTEDPARSPPCCRRDRWSRRPSRTPPAPRPASAPRSRFPMIGIQDAPALRLDPLLVVPEAGGGLQIRTAKEVHQPLEGGLRAGGEHDPFVIPGSVVVSRRGVMRLVPAGCGATPERQYDQEIGRHEAEEGFVEGEIQFLPATRSPFLVAERHHHAEREMKAGNHIGECERRIGGRAAWMGVHVGEAAHAFGQRPETGLGSVRPGLAVARDPADDRGPC